MLSNKSTPQSAPKGAYYKKYGAAKEWHAEDNVQSEEDKNNIPTSLEDMAKEFFTKTGNEKYRNISKYEDTYIDFLKFMINQPTPDYNTVLGKLKLLPPNISAMLCIIHCVEVLSHYSTAIAYEDRGESTRSLFEETQQSPSGVDNSDDATLSLRRTRSLGSPPRSPPILMQTQSLGGGAIAPIGRADSKILDNVKISKYIQYIINYYKTLDYNVFTLKIFIEDTDVSDGEKECFLQISFDKKDIKIDNINAYIIMTNIMYNDNQKLTDKFGEEDINLIKKLRSEINNVFFMDKELSSKAKGKYERTFASARKFSERKYDQIGIIKNLIGARKCERRRRWR